MNFIESLAKGFIRSAVNQVGRDGGKVISNKLYGNRHSTPIHNVTVENGVFYNEQTNQPLSYIELRKKISTEGYKTSYSVSGMGIIMKVWAYILGIICSSIFYSLNHILIIIPSILMILFVITLKLLMPNISVIKYDYVSTYTQDRRYKSGRRNTGTQRIKSTFQIPATEEEKKVIRAISVVYILLAIAMPFLGSELYKLFI